MEELGTVNFDDLFDFSPEPPTEDSTEKVSLFQRCFWIILTSISSRFDCLKCLERGQNIVHVKVSILTFNFKGQTTFGEDKYNLVNTFNSQSYSVQPQIGTNRSIEINSQSQQQQQLQPQSQEGNQFSVVQLSTSLPGNIYWSFCPEIWVWLGFWFSEPVGTKSKRGRKPGQKIVKQDMKTKLERSRQSARECRARKKLRYQYLDDILLERERANLKLRYAYAIQSFLI